MAGIIVTTPPTVELPPGNSSSNPASLPGVTYSYAVLNAPQTWLGKQTFPLGNIVLNAADVTGLVPVATGGAVLATQMPALTGDVTTLIGTVATTLTTVNSNVGTFGSASLDPIITVNGKGLVTAVSTQARREVLTANRTYFVSTTGNDSNSGLTALLPFLTPNKAMSVISGTLDLAGFTVTIQFADGTYADKSFIAQPYVGAGTVALVGNVTTPANVNFTISSAVNGIFNFSFVGGNWTIHGFKLSSSLGAGNGNGLYVAGNLGLVTFGNMNFGALAGGFHITAIYGGHIENDAAYTISGGAAYHLYSADNSILHTTASATITITGTPAFSTAFMTSHGSGAIIGTVEGNYSGAYTGTSATADDFGLIDIANPALLSGSGTAQLFSGGMIAGISANPTYGGAAYGGAGNATFANGTSGKIIVTAPSGALGTQTQTLPIASGTFVLSGRTTYGDVSTTLLPTDGPFIQLVNGLTVARTWTLPLANSLPAGTLLIISDAGGIGGANTLTIQRQGANTFNGIGVAGNAITMSTVFGSISVRNDGAGGWYLVAKT